MRLLSFLAACILWPVIARAQIGAEAQGGKLTSWMAVGLDQELSERWTSVTDIGWGTHSDPDNLAFLKRQGLIVFTQDFIYDFAPHWRVAASFGYWRRNFYDDQPPYDANPVLPYRNELRPFQRLYYDHAIGTVLVTHTLRTDYRFYWTPGFDARWPTPFEFRARYMVNFKVPVTDNHLNWIIVNDEILTAADKYSDAEALVRGKNWSPYVFTENRFSLYYRRRLQGVRADFDVGLMDQYWREVRQTYFTTSYNIMLDLIVYDPFSRHHKG